MPFSSAGYVVPISVRSRCHTTFTWVPHSAVSLRCHTMPISSAGRVVPISVRSRCHTSFTWVPHSAVQLGGCHSMPSTKVSASALHSCSSPCHGSVQLDSPEVSGSLVCVMAEAAAKSLEHTLLLSLLVPARQSSKTGEQQAASAGPGQPASSKAGVASAGVGVPVAGKAGKGGGGAAGPASAQAVEPLPVYRYGITHGYQVLPSARTLAGEGVCGCGCPVWSVVMHCTQVPCVECALMHAHMHTHAHAHMQAHTHTSACTHSICTETGAALQAPFVSRAVVSEVSCLCLSACSGPVSPCQCCAF